VIGWCPRVERDGARWSSLEPLQADRGGGALDRDGKHEVLPPEIVPLLVPVDVGDRGPFLTRRAL